MFAPMLIQCNFVSAKEGKFSENYFGAYLDLCICFLSAKKCCLRQFGAYYFGAYIFCAYVDPVCTFPSAKASLARTTLARVSICAHFSFLQRSVVNASLARLSMARISVCVCLLCAWYCLRHIFINIIKSGRSVM